MHFSIRFGFVSLLILSVASSLFAMENIPLLPSFAEFLILSGQAKPAGVNDNKEGKQFEETEEVLLKGSVNIINSDASVLLSELDKSPLKKRKGASNREIIIKYVIYRIANQIMPSCNLADLFREAKAHGCVFTPESYMHASFASMVHRIIKDLSVHETIRLYLKACVANYSREMQRNHDYGEMHFQITMDQPDK